MLALLKRPYAPAITTKAISTILPTSHPILFLILNFISSAIYNAK